VTDSPESPEIEEVRRLLADARHTEPMPDDVVAQMDDVIAGLRKHPDAGEDPSSAAPRHDNVVPLVRRRRRAVGMLAAAAAIVVGGVVVTQNLPQDTGSSSSSAGSATSAEDSAGAPRTTKPSHDDRLRDSGKVARKPVVKGGRLLVHPDSFSLDALAGRQLLERRANDSTTSLPAPSTDVCASVPTQHGTLIRATYQNAPAALVYRRASGGSQVVDLYVCGTAKPVRSATLPAP